MAKPSMKLNSGHEMPMFGLGTWLSKPGEVAASVKCALNNGYRHIDCAHVYGNEAEIGEVFHDIFLSSGSIKREEVFITSKLWVKDFNRVKEACQLSLKNLQLNYLDLYLIHLPFEIEADLESAIPMEKGKGVIGYNQSKMQEVWKSMEELVKEGLVKSIGISNFTCKKIKDLLDGSPSIKPACNQVELHPYLPQTKLLDYCNQQAIVLMAYTALGNPGRPDGEKRESDLPVLENEVIKSIADRHKVTSAQVLLAWALRRKTGVLAKSVKESRIKENFECLKVNLDTDDMNAINALTIRARYLSQQWALKVDENIPDLWDGEFLG